MLKKVAELEQGSRDGDRLDAKVDPSEVARGLAVVDDALEGFSGEPAPLLERMNARHAFNAHGMHGFPLCIDKITMCFHARVNHYSIGYTNRLGANQSPHRRKG